MTIALLILMGMVAATGLAIGAVIEITEAIVGLVVWAVIILATYLIIKIRF